MNKMHLFISLVCLILCINCKEKQANQENINLSRAEITLDSLYSHYAVTGSHLLRENYPFKDRYSATYLATAEESTANKYSYLWPYSGTLSAVSALIEATGSDKYKEILEKDVLPGLEEYFDTKRQPAGYASYINSAPQSDRFYDDNVWLGIDFTDLYAITSKQEYLDKAKLIWNFVVSGQDDKLDGGIYWCEQKKGSKNTCSNAPGAVFALKLFNATNDSLYFHQGKALYDWTKAHLQDPDDYMYFDNIKLNGEIGKAKYAYNSGQMMQAAALLYKLTHIDSYLRESQEIAKSCYNYFFTDFDNEEQKFRLIKKGDVWFTAVMLRGYIELYLIDKDPIFIDTFKQNLDYAWKYARDKEGLFEKDMSGRYKDKGKWLLTQAAMVEMYARIGSLK
jgi:uncharacterized protein YyaL (SSP411 family)